MWTDDEAVTSRHPWLEYTASTSSVNASPNTDSNAVDQSVGQLVLRLTYPNESLLGRIARTRGGLLLQNVLTQHGL